MVRIVSRSKTQGSAGYVPVTTGHGRKQIDAMVPIRRAVRLPVRTYAAGVAVPCNLKSLGHCCVAGPGTVNRHARQSSLSGTRLVEGANDIWIEGKRIQVAHRDGSRLAGLAFGCSERMGPAQP